MEADEADSWWKENWDTIAIGVAAGLTAQTLWVVVTSGFPEAVLALTDMTADLYARTVADSYFRSSSDVNMYFILIILSMLILFDLHETSNVESRASNLHKYTSITFILLITFFIFTSMLKFFSNESAHELHKELVQIRQGVPDSIYHGVRKDMASVESYEQLQAVRARIDSLKLPEE